MGWLAGIGALNLWPCVVEPWLLLLLGAGAGAAAVGLRCGGVEGRRGGGREGER